MLISNLFSGPFFNRAPKGPLAGKRAGLVAAVAVLMIAASSARAEDTGIAVSGVGTVKVKPTAIELSGTVSGDAELAADADIKFKDARKKAVELFEGMKIPGLVVTGGGASIHDHMDAAAQMRAMQGNGTSDGIKNKVQETEKLKLTITGIDKMTPEQVQSTVVKILDTARQAGLQVGPPPPTNYYQYQQMNSSGDALIVYKLADPAAARADAYKQAVADARAKAQQLAELSGGKLGKVVSVTEVSGQSNPYRQNNESEDEAKAVSSDTGEVNVSVHLSMRFELAQ